MKFTQQDITNQKIDLDGNEFVQCRFDACQLIYRGGPIPALVECEFLNVNWQFAGAAANTLTFMKALYNGGGEGGRLLVQQTISSLTKTESTPAQNQTNKGKPNLRIVRDDDDA